LGFFIFLLVGNISSSSVRFRFVPVDKSGKGKDIQQNANVLYVDTSPNTFWYSSSIEILGFSRGEGNS